MTGVKWWSQPYRPDGSATATGILRQLGRPGLDELTVLVREAAQNSWDARRSEDPVHFGVRIEQLRERAAAWREHLLPAPDGDSIGGFDTSLDEASWIIVISDRGTFGLRGPTRADISPADGEGHDFVQFLRNVGEPRDTKLGGGTYGFGKGIFYRLSRVGSILVSTSTHTTTGEIEHRFMGAGLGASFKLQGVPYTGRHWWGTVEGDVPDPLVGREATDMAEQLGLPTFEPGATGTDIVVMGADFGVSVEGDESVPRTPAAAADHIASAILWNLWPKLVDDGAVHAPMTFSVNLDGEALEIPHPSDVPSLSAYVESLIQVRDGAGRGYVRKGATLGTFAFSRRPSLEDSGVALPARPFDGPSRHTARMRAAELVVDYIEGPEPSDPRVQYGAVFKSAVEADEHFASAEPPTHDSWTESGLDGETQAVVRGARTFIRTRLRDELGLAPASGQSTSGLGELSSKLASLVSGVASVGAGGAAGGGGGPGSGGGSVGRKSRILDARLVIDESGPHVIVSMEVSEAAAPRDLTLRSVVVVDGGGTESLKPVGAIEPHILGWRAPSGEQHAGADPIRVDAHVSGVWEARVTHVADAVTRYTLSEQVVDG